MFRIPPKEERPELAFLLFVIVLSTSCFVLSLLSAISCDFVRRSVELDPDVQFVLPYGMEERLVHDDLLGFTGVAFGFWSYSVWGGGGGGGGGGENDSMTTMEVGGAEGACYPYHVCFVDGTYRPQARTPTSGLGSARAFAVLASVSGGIGMSFLLFAALYRLPPSRYMRSVGSVFWMACLCQVWTLVLMTRRSICGLEFFDYCLPRRYQAENLAWKTHCSLESGANMAISATVLWFVCSVAMCFRNWCGCLGVDREAAAAAAARDMNSSQRRRSARRRSSASQRAAVVGKGDGEGEGGGGPGGANTSGATVSVRYSDRALDVDEEANECGGTGTASGGGGGRERRNCRNSRVGSGTSAPAKKTSEVRGDRQIPSEVSMGPHHDSFGDKSWGV